GIVLTGRRMRITHNSITDNGALGINLAGGAGENAAGVTPNDPLDPDYPETGPNNMQNFPVVNAATSGAGNTTIAASLNSTPNTTFTLEFFSNSVIDPSTFGEGEHYLGSTDVTTDGNGDWSGTVTFTTA